MSEDHATPAEEEYLQIIYWLMEAELPITGANIARAMRLSPPTVHEMVGRLEHDGYVTRADDKSQEREDWLVIVGVNHLIAGIEAYVAAYLWDFPGDLKLQATPNGTAATVRVPVRFP